MNFALTQALQAYLVSATRTATTNGQTVEPTGYGCLVACVYVTAASGTGGLQPKWQYYDVAPISAWHDVESPISPIFSTGEFHFCLGRNGTPTALWPQYVNVPPFRRMRLVVVHGDASNYTYSAFLAYGQN